MSTRQIGILAAIIVHLAAMVHVGSYFNKKGGGGSADEFYLGGRKLGALMTVMNAEASDMSSWPLVGLPGVIYLTDTAGAEWTTIGLAVGTYLNRLIVAKRLRRYSATYNAITIPDFFSRRYRDGKNILIYIAVVVILIFFIPYTASGSKAVGTLFNSSFGVNYHVAMITDAVVIIGCTVLSSFIAVSTTGLIQSIVMSIALVIVVFFGISVAGGWEAVADSARSLTGYLNMTHIHGIQGHASSPYGFITILSTLAWELGYFEMSHILLCFMAVSHEDKLRTSRRVASIWVVISMFVAILIGIIGYGASVASSIPIFASNSESETMIIRLANLLGRQGVLLSVVAGVVLTGILACTMSTADSQLLTAASGVSQNLPQDFLKIKMDSKTSTASARLTAIVIALVGIALTWNPDSSVFTIVSFAWAGFGASFGPVMLFVLFWKRSNLQGTLAGMIAGGVTAFVWKYDVRPLGGVWDIYELLPTFLAACATAMIVSLATEAPYEEICREFDSVGK